ncbi:MAG: PRC-barrel domain containing protein [Acidobacteria bacterium]|nr:MAG: PRC-barrel domain containing protein [Acidobacteriota bacterium]RPJ63125.1 MAG: PRC-barrel domain containing protein [Acidobacteriota bacterium]
MIRFLSQIKGSTIHAVDGDIGKVVDCYFDEQRWAVRYLVVETGSWLSGRQVLISPASVDRVDWNDGRVNLNIDRMRVKNSPSADLAQPVSREWESSYSEYYGYPHYWEGTDIWGSAATPGTYASRSGSAARTTGGEPYSASEVRGMGTGTSSERGLADSQLRSAKEVAGYHIRATDGEIGHIDDFLMDRDSWVIDSILIDTSNMPGGKPVLLRRERIDRIDWNNQEIRVRATTQEIKNIPEYVEETTFGRRR